MPIYTSSDIRSGVPLGGIGAGKMEILPSGLFSAFTFLNNWHQPLSGNEDYPGILGYHLGFRVEPGKKAFLLQTVPFQGLPVLKKIRYEGDFARALLTYQIPGAGVDVELEAFSSWIPGDVRHSSLPCAFFDLRVKNKNRHPITAAFLFIGRNVCGEWCVGRKNRLREDKDALYLEFSNRDPSKEDAREGEIVFSFPRSDWRLSFMEGWNSVTKNFSYAPGNVRLTAWERFSEKGELPNTKPGLTAEGENREYCGAVAAKRSIPPGSEKRFSFTAAWYFPSHRSGHRYALWFKSAADAAGYALPRKDAIKKKSDEIRRLVFSLPFPRWFNDALLTNLAPFYSSSWLTKRGDAVFYEAPVTCPLMGTLDVGFYGSIPVSYFFPELEMAQMRLFARAQRPDGYVPHDLGKNRIDRPSSGTTFYHWKDLSSKFALMAYRDFLWSGNRAFLRQIYPAMKKALGWIAATDRDGNGLPDNEGADQTFDIWEFRGTSAYTSGIFLAALLAGERTAEILRDEEFADECRRRFLRGRASFEKELWGGRYFGETCALSQLNGQWYARLLGMGDIADKTKIRTALKNILRLNRRPSRFGFVNSVKDDGSLDTSNSHAKNIWFGMNYAFLSLCILEGMPVNKLLKEARPLWDNVVRRQRNPWNQPDMVDSKTGTYLFGDAYYRNMAIWSIPIAYAMKDKKALKTLHSMRSQRLMGNKA